MFDPALVRLLFDNPKAVSCPWTEFVEVSQPGKARIN
jgi:hypothetical protein